MDKPASNTWSQGIVWGLCLGIAAFCVWLRPHLGAAVWIPGASVLALVVGTLAVHWPGGRAALATPSKVVVKKGIPYAIVMIGFGLNLSELWQADVLGLGLLAVVLGMLVAFGSAILFARLLGLDPRTGVLLGAGTAVCGNSAIMAVAPVVEPEEEDLGLCLGVINLLGLLMVFVLPPVAALFGIGGGAGGILAGMAVHAVPQAAAAGEAFGPEALKMATLYKLVRVGLLMPTVLLVAFLWTRRGGGQSAGKGKAKVPAFLWLFVGAVLLRSTGLLDGQMALPILGDGPLWKHLQIAGKFLLTAVMAAVGMGIFVPSLVRVGPRILWVGVFSAALMTLVCAGMVRLLA